MWYTDLDSIIQFDTLQSQYIALYISHDQSQTKRNRPQSKKTPHPDSKPPTHIQSFLYNFNQILTLSLLQYYHYHHLPFRSSILPPIIQVSQIHWSISKTLDDPRC